jgi:hypothetical protein
LRENPRMPNARIPGTARATKVSKRGPRKNERVRFAPSPLVGRCHASESRGLLTTCR